MKRVADYIADFIFELGVDTVFTVTGGGAMFLNDGVASHSKLKAICNHHEQACAMGAVGYAKYRNSYAVCMTTTGCGSTNAITGLLDAWQDNVPCIFISGQVKRKETVRNSGLRLRQFGVQEADIISVVQSLTKYSVMVNDPSEIAFHLEKAAYLARSGRPGPIWIDVPLDVQGAVIDPDTLKHFDPASETRVVLDSEISTLICSAKRPVLIAGNGIRLGNAVSQLREFVERYSIPVVQTYLGVDLLPTDHPLCVGRIGIRGTRAGNFAMQNADLVLSVGSRLCVPSTGFEYNLFAREAKVLVVDVDEEEHKKKTVRIDKFIHADACQFFEKCNLGEWKAPSSWAEKCRHWRCKWPVCTPETFDDKEGINLFAFVDRLSKNMCDDAVVVSDAGSSYYVTSQTLSIRANQRYITSGGQADMGFGLPAAIGVCAAQGGKPVIAITGDGSFQMNIQELQTVVHNKLPIKLFVWNNNGYLSIRTTQSKFFDGRFIGTDSASGVSFPDLNKIADAYGIPYLKAATLAELDSVLPQALATDGPVLFEVIAPANQQIVPAVSSVKRADGTMLSKPLEDMFPFLEREEFLREMIVKPIQE